MKSYPALSSLRFLCDIISAHQISRCRFTSTILALFLSSLSHANFLSSLSMCWLKMRSRKRGATRIPNTGVLTAGRRSRGCAPLTAAGCGSPPPHASHRTPPAHSSAHSSVPALLSAAALIPFALCSCCCIPTRSRQWEPVKLTMGAMGKGSTEVSSMERAFCQMRHGELLIEQMPKQTLLTEGIGQLRQERDH